MCSNRAQISAVVQELKWRKWVVQILAYARWFNATRRIPQNTVDPEKIYYVWSKVRRFVRGNNVCTRRKCNFTQISLDETPGWVGINHHVCISNSSTVIDHVDLSRASIAALFYEEYSHWKLWCSLRGIPHGTDCLNIIRAKDGRLATHATRHHVASILPFFGFCVFLRMF